MHFVLYSTGWGWRSGRRRAKGLWLFTSSHQDHWKHWWKWASLLKYASFCSDLICSPDCAVLNLQGDKGEAGAAGRDVSWTTSPLCFHLLVFVVCFHPSSRLFHPALPVLILLSVAPLYSTLATSLPVFSPLVPWPLKRFFIGAFLLWRWLCHLILAHIWINSLLTSSYMHALTSNDQASTLRGEPLLRGTKCQSAVFMCKFILIISGTSVEGWQQPPALI